MEIKKEKESPYTYQIVYAPKNKQDFGWVYSIYHKDTNKAEHHSSEWFDTKVQAELSAKTHISLLQKELT